MQRAPSLPPHKRFLTLDVFEALAHADHPSDRGTDHTVPDDEGGGRTWRVTFVLVAIGLLMVNFAARLLDRTCKRSDDCVDLQVRITDAWRRHAMLAKLPIAATVGRSPWWRAPTTIVEVTGPMPGPTLQELALRIVREEASRSEGPFRIRDQFDMDREVVARVA